jgi:arylsulfatase A-like enzyme
MVRAFVGTLLFLCLGLPAAAIDAADPQNLVLITVDTLRRDRIGAYGYAAAQTPSLDTLAADSIRFDRAYAHASMTLPSVATLLTGLLPATHGVYDNRGTLPASVPTLATRLEEKGFRSGAFLGNYALRPKRQLTRGFEHYTEEFSSREGVRDHPENRGGLLTQKALAWLDTLGDGDRFFLWVHYQEPHGPYEPPDFVSPASGEGPVLEESATKSGRAAIPKYQWLGHGRLREYEARYDGEIREMDRHLGALILGLRERGLLDRSVVVFTSDHGEAFGEDDLYCAHGEGLDDSLLRVPLLLRVPGHAPGVRSDRVGLTDVLPTLADLLGFPTATGAGASLLEDRGDRPVVAQVGLNPDQSWRRAMRGNLDLRETPGGVRRGTGFEKGSDGVLSEAGKAEREKLLGFVERSAPWPGAGSEPTLTETEHEALKALGYVD